MATDQQLAAVRDAVTKRMDELLALPTRQSAVRANLGEINFSAALPTIERTFGLVGQLKGLSLDFVSHGRLTNLQNLLQQIVEALKQIEAFNLSVPNPAQQRDSIVQTLQNQYDGWFEQISGVVAFAVRSSTDFAALESSLREKIAQVEVIIKDTSEKQAAAVKTSEETLASIRKAAAEAGVSQQAIYFKNEATEHATDATRWLKATCMMAVLTVAWGALSFIFWTPAADATVPQVLHDTVAKVIILSGLYYGLVWTARNYNASRHNYVINKHRQNSLSTFETFVKAAESDPDTKNAVLLQTTLSVFTAQPSGYSIKEPEPDQPSKIIEILRSAGSTAKAS
jgi:hypothetical protein